VFANERIERMGLKFGLHSWIMSDVCLLQSARLMVAELNGCSLLGDRLKVEQLGFGLMFVVVFDFLTLLSKLIKFGLGNGERLAVALFGLKRRAFGMLFCRRLNGVMWKKEVVTADWLLVRMKFALWWML